MAQGELQSIGCAGEAAVSDNVRPSQYTSLGRVILILSAYGIYVRQEVTSIGRGVLKMRIKCTCQQSFEYVKYVNILPETASRELDPSRNTVNDAPRRATSNHRFDIADSPYAARRWPYMPCRV
jgi:hypothetical protein